jgi:type II secretory pathway component GspD/PulD (secretin)
VINNKQNKTDLKHGIRSRFHLGMAIILTLTLFAMMGTCGIHATPSNKDLQINTLKSQLPKSSQSVSLTFSKTDIREILRFFSLEFGMNIIANDEVQGEISFGFKNIDIVTAFDAILTSQGLEWRVERGIIHIYKQQPSAVIKLNYAIAAELASPLAQLLSDKGSITTDTHSNALVIKASRGDLERLKSIVSELDKRPSQVLVEVAIMDVQGDDSNIFGVGPNTTLPNGSTIKQNGLANTVADGGSGLFLNVIEGNFNVLLEALQSNQNIDLLATPKILTVNHKKAQIVTGQRLGYRTTTSSTDGNFVSEGVDFLDVGTKFTFTPHIAENGDIIMDIKPEVSEGNVNDSGIPNEDTTQAETTVLVRDGQTVLIGGLIREKKTESITGVPLLSDIPFIGDLFRKKSTVTVKKETMVLITPRLVTPETIRDIVPNRGNKQE